MDWKDVSAAVGKAAPILGSLLGGPAGAAAGAIIASALGVPATPDDVSRVVQNPESYVSLKRIEATRQVELQALLMHAEANRLAADTATIQAVNQTMQAEAVAKHWPTYTWRPFCGFVFGVMFIGVYFVLPLLKLPVPDVPTEAWIAIGAILGVASWYRGRTQLASQQGATTRERAPLDSIRG